jgi:hypothetical protein
LICAECGNYQPDRAKFCGICGAALSQEGALECFLGEECEQEMTLPRHRSILFYLAMLVIVIAAAALLAGATYLVYLVAWGGEESVEEDSLVEANTLDYIDPELGFSLAYLKMWTLEEGVPSEDQLVSIQFILSPQKVLEMYAYRMDPIVMIGGIEGIEEYVAEDAAERISVLGGQVVGLGSMGTSNGQEAYGEEETPAEETGDTALVPGREEGSETVSPEEMLASDIVNDLPVFYTEFTANFMGEETKFLLYYIVASDLLFVFQGRAPVNEFQDVRPQFMVMVRSFKWELTEEPTAPGMPEISVM